MTEGGWKNGDRSPAAISGCSLPTATLETAVHSCTLPRKGIRVSGRCWLSASRLRLLRGRQRPTQEKLTFSARGRELGKKQAIVKAARKTSSAASRHRAVERPISNRTKRHKRSDRRHSETSDRASSSVSARRGFGDSHPQDRERGRGTVGSTG
jgi:hypothetical protein